MIRESGEVDHHRRVEGHQTGFLVDRVEQGAQVAESGKNFGVLLDKPEIQVGENLHGAVAAPLGEDDFHLRVQKSLVNLAGLGRRGGEIRGDPPIDNPEAQFFQVLDTLGKISLFLDQPTRRDRANNRHGFSPQPL